MKDKKITIIQILIIIMIIAIVSVAIIFVVSSDDSKVGKTNSQNETEEIYPQIAVEKKEYIPNASDKEKVQRGYELFGYEKCSLSEFSLKNEEEMYEDKEHPMMAGQAETSWNCAICGKTDIYPNTAVPKLCVDCANITNRCMRCGKLTLDEKEYRLSWEDFKNKENILEAIQKYWIEPDPELCEEGYYATKFLYITEDYYIYKLDYHGTHGLNFYKKIDEKIAKNIINDISKLKDDKVEEKNYKITTKDYSISVKGEEISNILKKYGINIFL